MEVPDKVGGVSDFGKPYKNVQRIKRGRMVDVDPTDEGHRKAISWMHE